MFGAPPGATCRESRQDTFGESMKLSKLNLMLAASGLMSMALVGCGGGSDAAAPTEAPVNVPVTVVDGAIQNAVVCLDRNANGACDAGEPTGKTNADGNVTLEVPAADAGKYPIVAIVGTDAIDKDNGPVAVPYTMKAPADAPAVVSPLTTLVQAHVETTNTTTAEAKLSVADQLGVSGDALMADFTKANDAASLQAGTLARLVVVTKQEQVTATSGATGAGGSALSAAEIEAAVNARLLQLLPSLIVAASDPAVASAATPAAKEAALLAAAQAVAAEAGLTKDNIGAVVAVNQQAGTAESAADTGAGGTLRWLSFSNLQNYFIRAFESTAEQATVDANGKRHFTEWRESMVNGVLKESGAGGANDLPRNQIYWTGAEWFDCPLDFVSEATPWNAQGESESLFCKSFKSRNKRKARDIAGLSMADLVREIRAYPMTDTAGKFSEWGPDPVVHAATLDGKTFPAGSKLYYFTGTPLVNPDAYGTAASDIAKVFSPALVSGETAACAAFTANTQGTEAATLEEVIAGAPGTPCVYTANPAVHGAKNESWGPTTVGIGDVTVAPFAVPSDWYRNDFKRYRASFGANHAVTYYECVVRADGTSVRNCSQIGTGTYSIEAKGDARVLRFANLPAIGRNSDRILVERAGKVHYGSRDKLTVSNQLRLNLAAADALLAALGLE
jgi:hypothetical protein